MRLFRKLLILVLIMLAFVEFNFRPSVEERLILELNNVHAEIVKGKAIFNEMKHNPTCTTVMLNEMGCDLNYFIAFFNKKLHEISILPSFKNRKSLPREINLIEKINCP